jgi:hypothetical protein
MPAWIGFEFLQRFFQETAKWKQVNGKTLTHSVGLVFCSAKTPIRITQQLARMIADHIKEESKKTKEGKRDAWDYMALESIDYPTYFDYPRFIRKRYGDIGETRPILIPPHQLWDGNRKEIIDFLRNQLPTRQLYQLGQMLTRNLPAECFARETKEKETWPPPNEEGISLMETQERRMLEVSEDSTNLEEIVVTLCELFGLDLKNQQQRAWLWLHLLELKDYISPGRK